MSSGVLKYYFLREFILSTEKFLKENNLSTKVVLLLDNAPMHLDADEQQDGGIKAMLLSPNVTAISQLI